MKTSPASNKIILFLIFSSLISCQNNKQTPDPEPVVETTEVLSASTQRAGNIGKGYDYLVNGNYVDGGIPLSLWNSVRTPDNTNILKRQGDNAKVGYQYTVITTSNNTRAVGANCLNCHASYINTEFVMGLGNTTFDFSIDQSANINLLDALLKSNYSIVSPEYQPFIPYKRGLQAIGPLTITETQGVNPADKYAAILASHRNPSDLTWRENDPWGIPNEVIPTDVPAWWLLKKKNTMFNTGVGTGDFARIMMASSLVSLQDSSQARKIDQRFPDVLAYIKSLPSPTYKGTIDQQKATEGRAIYEVNCSRCHGSSTNKNDYPNLLVSLESIGTDPALVSTNFSYPQLLEWYNTSWFSKEPFAAKLIAKKGYIAPPLDGIWATAPYLHNGSVPTLEDLLNSSQRPKIWKRTFNFNDFDNKKVGWNYVTLTSKTDTKTYDTSIRGYGNQGHIYGDKLTVSERSSLIEYLKTL
jgi:hypothetical protein